jgi:outer membrane protein assembly factor BamB
MTNRLFLAITILFVSAPRLVIAADWPFWRGQNRNAVSKETGLRDSWDTTPKLAWKASKIGQGYSSVVVSKGKIFTTGSVDKDVYCLALAESTGKLLWRT